MYSHNIQSCIKCSMDNFNAPYLSTSVAAFWRHWHISITSWFTDYLYIPLGGNRKGTKRKYLNKMIVFLTSGLWHGAELSFIVWGGLNGLYQVLGEALCPVRNKLITTFGLNRDYITHKLFRRFITFVLVDLSWVFFRADKVTIIIAVYDSDIWAKQEYNDLFQNLGVDTNSISADTAFVEIQNGGAEVSSCSTPSVEIGACETTIGSLQVQLSEDTLQNICLYGRALYVHDPELTSSASCSVTVIDANSMELIDHTYLTIEAKHISEIIRP